jgi:hypothetical protein
MQIRQFFISVISSVQDSSGLAPREIFPLLEEGSSAPFAPRNDKSFPTAFQPNYVK